MFNSLDVLDDLVPVSELSNGRTSAVLSKADRAPVIIIKRNKPSYVLMGINDYQDLLDRLEDTEDVRLAEKRIEDNDGRATIPNADLMAELGLTEEDIADAAEYARQLSLELNGSVVKVFDAETGLVIFTAKSRAKIED